MMTSSKAAFAFVAVMLCGGVCCLGENNTAIMVSRGGVLLSNLGSNVTLHCVVSGTGWNPFYDQIIWYKSNFQINTGAVINAPFDVTQRHLIDKQTSSFTDGRGQISVSLTVINVSLEDNGTYRCALYRLQSLSASANYEVIVIAPVTELRLYTNHSTVSSANITNSVLQFHSADTFVTCEAVGGNPAPRLRVCVGKTDVTSQFEQVIVSPSSKDDTEEHVTRIVSGTWQTDIDGHQGRTLKCVARVQTGHGRPDLKTTVSATIDVRFSPQVTCSPPIVTIHRSRYGDEGRTTATDNDEVKVELKCSVRANPPVNDTGVEWTVINRNNVSVTVSAGQVVGIFHAISVNAVGSNTLLTRDAVLLIPLVNYTSRAYSYYLLANNNVGLTSIRFDLNPLRNTTTSKLPSTSVTSTVTQAITKETVTSHWRPLTSLYSTVKPSTLLVETVTSPRKPLTTLMTATKPTTAMTTNALKTVTSLEITVGRAENNVALTTETVTSPRKPVASSAFSGNKYVYSSTPPTTSAITTGTSRRRHQKESDRTQDSVTEQRSRIAGISGSARNGVDTSRRVGGVGFYKNAATTDLSGNYDRRINAMFCVIVTVIVDCLTALNI